MEIFTQEVNGVAHLRMTPVRELGKRDLVKQLQERSQPIPKGALKLEAFLESSQTVVQTAGLLPPC